MRFLIPVLCFGQFEQFLDPGLDEGGGGELDVLKQGQVVVGIPILIDFRRDLQVEISQQVPALGIVQQPRVPFTWGWEHIVKVHFAQQE